MPPLLSYIAAGVLGVISAFAMPPYGVIVALLCFGGVVMCVARAQSAKAAMLFSGIYAFGYFAFGLYWVQNALGVTMGDMPWLRPIALLGLPLILALFWAAAGFAAGRIWARADVRAIGFMGLIGVAEILRAFVFTGFPWNYFAYAWGAADLPAMQAAAPLGTHALNLLTLFWAGAFGLWPLLYGRTSRFVLLGVWAGIAIITNGYGAARLMKAGETEFDEGVQVVVVQPNILQSEKWDIDKQFAHLQAHIALSQDALAQVRQRVIGGNAPTQIIVVWPETAIDDYALAKDPRMAQALNDFLNEAGAHSVTPDFSSNFSPNFRLVSGILRGAEGNYYNSIASLGATAQGNITAHAMYDKRTLVPFGEYIPLVERFGITPITGFSGFTAGKNDGFLRDEALPLAAAQICYEAIFPLTFTDMSDAEWIVNVSNDGWYGDTSGPYQHLMMSRYRALETGLPMLRSTTTGISAVIDSHGKVLSSIAYGKKGYLISALPKKTLTAMRTPYFRGAAIFLIFSLWVVAIRIISK